MASEFAIVGMSCRFPGSLGLSGFWKTLKEKSYSLSQMDDFFARRFLNAEFNHSSASEPSHSLYTLSYGTIRDIIFVDSLRFGVPPSTIEGDPSQHICLQTAAEAFADYINHRTSIRLDNSRVGVIIGKGDHPHRGLIAGLLHGIGIEQTTDILVNALQLARTKDIYRILRKYLAERIVPAYDRNLAPNLISNVISGTIANKLGFMGPNLLVDAACTSALVGLDYGLNLLSSKTCDAILLGGVQATMNVPIYELFTALEALSSSTINPMCRNTNGTLLSEGVGFVVVKRLEDAIECNDRIYSIIDGLGISSDGRGQGLLAPNSLGQLTAINRAYDASSLSTDDISLVEVHATGINHGDQTELLSLKEGFRTRDLSAGYIPLTSVKSVIGHCIPASGMASMIKLSLSLYKRQMIAGIACDPLDSVSDPDSIFYLLKHDSYWEQATSTRACAMNSFGFGGINGHLILKESTQDEKPSSTYTLSSGYHHSNEKDLKVFSGILKDNISVDLPFYCIAFTFTSWQELNDCLLDLKLDLQISHGLTQIGDVQPNTSLLKGYIIANSVEELSSCLDLILIQLRDQNTSCQLLKGTNWLFRFMPPYSRDEVCFLIPGEGSPSVKSVNSQLLSLHIFRSWLNQIDSISGKSFSLLSLVRALCSIEQNDEHKRNHLLASLYRTDIATQIQALTVFAFAEILRTINVFPSTIIGHSAGEADAIVLSGLTGPTDKCSVMTHLIHLNEFYMQNHAKIALETGQCYAITGLSPERILELCDTTPGLFLVSINSPTQSIVYISQECYFDISSLSDSHCIVSRTELIRPYHTPHFKEMAESYQGLYNTLLPESPSSQCTVISCLDNQPYSTHDRNSIISKLITQWHSPVNFHGSLLSAYRSGSKLFIEIGQSSVLTSYARETFRSVDGVTCLSLGTTSSDPYHILRTVMHLWTILEGVNIDLFFNDLLCHTSLDSQPIYDKDRHIPIVSSTPFIDTSDLHRFLVDNGILKSTPPAAFQSASMFHPQDISHHSRSATNYPDHTDNSSQDIDVAAQSFHEVAREILMATEKATSALLNHLQN